MIYSMTGFGRSEASWGGKKIIVEMKSLNHRFLEVSLRSPAALASFDIDVKKRIGERLSRGRVEVVIRIDSGEEGDLEGRLVLNMPRLRSYYNLLLQMKEELGLPDPITLEMMVGLRDVFVVREADEEALPWEALEKVLQEAMSAMTAMRQAEGESLKRDLLARIVTIRESLATIRSRSPAVVLDYRRRLAERIKELTNGTVVDEGRLCQEVAMMAEKSDITEEVVRLESHLVQFVDLLEYGETAGRKLDFLIQEMNREANTIGSKSSDGEIARLVIEIKSELSKLREQVQNIE